MGGDSELTETGKGYAKHLAQFFKKEFEDEKIRVEDVKILTSTLQRALRTTGEVS